MQTVAVIAHQLRFAGGLNVGRSLVTAFAEARPEIRFVCYVPSGAGYEGLLEPFENVHTIPVNAESVARRLWFERVGLPAEVRSLAPDLVLALGNVGIDRSPATQAILCHDPHLFYPESHYATETRKRKLWKRYLASRLARQLREGAILLCQTEVAEKRLRNTYSFDGRVILCPQAVSSEVVDPHDGVGEPAEVTGLAGKPRLFCLTRYYPHKNLEMILDAFELHPESMGQAIVVLTIAEDHHPYAKRLLSRVEQSGLSSRIVNVGPLPQARIAEYYRWADALLMPTTLESFSSTYIEAMRFGTPILASDMDFARVVCGDAAEYFDAASPRSLVEAVSRLRTSRDLSSALAARGRARLQLQASNWREIASRVLEELEDQVRNPTTGRT